ncbi:hypothetical protein PIB30_083012 [Stylosanthes scabra]|uniref:Uncharacterized protein n=1 Tax=Stylosanthes scabra TaxID=79078 RepID=A0ABU6TU32_9FABA|nr:hypothetical protein [Stylosanthes scabra]
MEGYDVRSFRVHLNQRKHALAACAVTGIEWGRYVDPMYRIQFVFSVYQMELPPILDEQYWPPWHRTVVRPNPSMRQKKWGRPMSTRIRNGMDIVKHAGTQ